MVTVSNLFLFLPPKNKKLSDEPSSPGLSKTNEYGLVFSALFQQKTGPLDALRNESNNTIFLAENNLLFVFSSLAQFYVG